MTEPIRDALAATTPEALAGLKVVEIATLFAGPLAATFLGDLGADVLKIEHPSQPDPARHHGPSKDGVGLWWKVIGRNKRLATLDLSTPDGQRLFGRIARSADVVIENFRPGTLERWDLGYDRLAAENPGLVLARVTGFGQLGPYAKRAGFGTIAEAMSGFAALTGEPDGPPTLPPFGLADGVAALAIAYGVMAALHARRARRRRPRSLRSTTCATSSPIPSTRRSGPSPQWTMTSWAASRCRTSCSA